ncbi:MAG: Gfo/Idh/MocA family oxidoreductase [Clostridia bacterium]|nr:Gfo/Idh/MocA family oxidoreductase [Clostridia bacterium]
MKKIRLGVFGVRRGSYYFESFLANNADIVAICDVDELYMKKAVDKLGGNVTTYKSFDEFIEHPMDAVFVANYFHEHAEYAIRCLEKNIHVLCECTANSTMAEGVKLVRAAEKSKAFYMLAENYPYMLFNQEMKKVYEGGTLGEVLYAEGEYNHPGDPYSTENLSLLFDNDKHWRFFLPRTYYITHSLAPIMYATGSEPVRVSAMPIFAPGPKDCPRAGRVGDRAAIVTCLNNDNSVFKVTGHASFGGEDNSYRICGEKGMIENVRGTGGMISLNYNRWQIPEGKEEHNYYKPELIDKDAELIKKSGHGGGDFFVARTFLNCIRDNKAPDFDVYFATKLASVAILGHRSILNGGIPYDVPDFRKEEDRVKFENDNESPFWYSDGRAPTIPCCSVTDFAPTDVQIEKFNNAIEEDRKNQK